MPRPVVIAVLACAAAAGVVVAVLLRGGGREASAPPATGTAAAAPSAPSEPAATAPGVAPTAPTESEAGTSPSPPAETGPPPGIPTVAPPWAGKGAFVWHETDVDPGVLAGRLRDAGFAWVALRLHDGLEVDPVEERWIERLRLAGGPPVGGWGVLRDAPEQEAALAVRLLREHGLGFYVANAEAEYGVHGDQSRSGRFVATFRTLLPGFPAALSTTCGPGGVDLGAWRNASFALLPQAYVNEFGSDVDPGVCVAKGAPYGRDEIHPTVGTYASSHAVEPGDYVRLLRAAGTVGFSVYLAETDMTAAGWSAFGRAIAQGGLTG